MAVASAWADGALPVKTSFLRPFLPSSQPYPSFSNMSFLSRSVLRTAAVAGLSRSAASRSYAYASTADLIDKGKRLIPAGVCVAPSLFVPLALDTE